MRNTFTYKQEIVIGIEGYRSLLGGLLAVRSRNALFPLRLRLCFGLRFQRMFSRRSMPDFLIMLRHDGYQHMNTLGATKKTGT